MDDFFVKPCKMEDRIKRVLLLINNVENRLSLYPKSSHNFFALINNWGQSIDLFGRSKQLLIELGMLSPFTRGFSYNVKDLYNYYVAVFPLLHTSPQLATLECMAMGIPCITSPREGFPENEHGKSYFLAKKPQDFDWYLNELFSNADFSKRVAYAGREFVKKYYNADDWRSNVLSFLQGHGLNV